MPPAVDFAGGLARLARLQALRCRSDLGSPLSPVLTFRLRLFASKFSRTLSACCLLALRLLRLRLPCRYARVQGLLSPPAGAWRLLLDCHFVYFGIHYAKTINNRFDSRSAYNASSKPMKSVFNLRVRFMKELQDMLRRVKFSTVRQWIYCKTEMTIFAKLTVS